MDAELRSRTQEERLQRELELKISILDKQKRVVFEGLNREQQKWRRHFLRYQLQLEMNAASKLGDIKGQELFRQLSKLSRNISQKAEYEIVAFLKKMRGVDGTQRLRRLRGFEFDNNSLINKKAGSRSLKPLLSVLNWTEADQNGDKNKYHRSDIGNNLNWTVPNQPESDDYVNTCVNQTHVTLSVCEFGEFNNIPMNLLTPKNDASKEKQLPPVDFLPAAKAEHALQILTPPLIHPSSSQSTIPHPLPLLLSPRSRLTHSVPQNNIVLATQEFRKIRSRDYPHQPDYRTGN